MDDKIYASIRMTDSITQQDTSFEQVRFINAISTTTAAGHGSICVW